MWKIFGQTLLETIFVWVINMLLRNILTFLLRSLYDDVWLYSIYRSHRLFGVNSPNSIIDDDPIKHLNRYRIKLSGT